AVARRVYAAPTPYTVGITGAPGSGKSTLTNELVRAARRGWAAGDGSACERPDAENAIAQVGVLAVDPSSPFSGGAILADRVRMQEHATDPSVFIRSMATRGHLGGLALAVPDAVRVLGAAGFPLVIIETVGVGQMEVEVASAADTTVVVVTPGWGDAMQASKAGLLEIADMFVVNKADRPGVEEARRDLQQMLDLSSASDWRPPVLTTVAVGGDGIEELWTAVASHREHLEASGELERRRAARLGQELLRVLAARVLEDVRALSAGSSFESAVSAIAGGTLDPYRAAEDLLGARADERAKANEAPK
ncbi:MAG: methylmalonyl Co-A mutase-associated GTPase MeaB, partial [Acidimicrobiales bacterium]